MGEWRVKRLSGTVRAIVFDLDDTLYPEVQYVRSGFRVAAQRLAGSDCDAERVFDLLWQTFENGPRDRVFNTVLEQLGESDDPQVIAELVGLYRCHRPSLQLEPAVRGMLEQLHIKYKLGLITDGFLPAQKLKVETLQLDGIFDHIIYTEELGREFWKPSPKAFEMMSEAMNCSGQECVYIADNPSKDFIAPNQLGWQSVQVQRADRIHTDVATVAGGGPRIVIDDVTRLSEVLAAN